MLERALAVTAIALLGACSEPPPPADSASTPPTTATVADGFDAARASYAHWCGACHDAGPEHPATMRLALRAGPAHAVLLERADLPPAYIRQIVRSGLGMMPPFRPSEISDAELHRLAAYVGRHHTAR